MIVTAFQNILKSTFIGIVMLHLPVSAVGTANRALTLYTDRDLSWDEAARVCESMGSQLLTVDSEDVRLKLEYFKYSKGWNTDIWIGLHAMVEGNYAWHYCDPLGGYTPWLNKMDEYQNRCVLANQALAKDLFWENHQCSLVLGKAVCEKVEGECSFFTMSKKEVSGIDPLILSSIVSLDECKRACLDDNSSTECWGFHLIAGSPCSLYHAQSQAEFRDHFQNSLSFIYIKTCFSGKTDSIDLSPYTYTISDWAASIIPWSGCPVDSTITTTTTAVSSSETPTGSSKTTTTTYRISTTGTPTIRVAERGIGAIVVPHTNVTQAILSSTKVTGETKLLTSSLTGLLSGTTSETRTTANIETTTSSTRHTLGSATPGSVENPIGKPDTSLSSLETQSTSETRTTANTETTTPSTRHTVGSATPGSVESPIGRPDTSLSSLQTQSTSETRTTADTEMTTSSTRRTVGSATPGSVESPIGRPDTSLSSLQTQSTSETRTTADTEMTTSSTHYTLGSATPGSVESPIGRPDTSLSSLQTQSTSETRTTANTEMTTSSTRYTLGSATPGSVERTTGKPDTSLSSLETLSTSEASLTTESSTMVSSSTMSATDLKQDVKTKGSTYSGISTPTPSSINQTIITTDSNMLLTSSGITPDHHTGTSSVACACRCRLTTHRFNDTEKKAFMDELVKSLTINKSIISATKRKYQSEIDPRPSARSVGCVGIVLLGLTFGGLILSDLRKLFQDLLRSPERNF